MFESKLLLGDMLRNPFFPSCGSEIPTKSMLGMIFSGRFTKCARFLSTKTPQEPEQSCQAEMYADTFYNYEADTDVVSVARMLVDSLRIVSL